MTSYFTLSSLGNYRKSLSELQNYICPLGYVNKLTCKLHCKEKESRLEFPDLAAHQNILRSIRRY